MRLSELVRLAGGFRPAAYAGRPHIERLNPADSTRYFAAVELRATSLLGRGGKWGRCSKLGGVLLPVVIESAQWLRLKLEC